MSTLQELVEKIQLKDNLTQIRIPPRYLTSIKFQSLLSKIRLRAERKGTQGIPSDRQM